MKTPNNIDCASNKLEVAKHQLKLWLDKSLTEEQKNEIGPLIGEYAGALIEFTGERTIETLFGNIKQDTVH